MRLKRLPSLTSASHLLSLAGHSILTTPSRRQSHKARISSASGSSISLARAVIGHARTSTSTRPLRAGACWGKNERTRLCGAHTDSVAAPPRFGVTKYRNEAIDPVVGRSDPVWSGFGHSMAVEESLRAPRFACTRAAFPSPNLSIPKGMANGRCRLGDQPHA